MQLTSSLRIAVTSMVIGIPAGGLLQSPLLISLQLREHEPFMLQVHEGHAVSFRH